MSVIFITEHDENIYSISAKDDAHRKKATKFRKKNVKGDVTRERDIKEKPSGKKWGVMGPPSEELPDPCNFLKKHADIKMKTKQEPEKFQCLKTKKLPSVPRRSEIAKQEDGKCKKKDFITENIKDVVHKKPKDPEKRVVIDRHGDTKELSRGLVPQYIYSPTFGKTPEYLQRLIKMKEKVLQLKKDIYGTEQPKCRYITREERENLLAV